MANFQTALPHILRWEGGYINNPNDYGKETYAGIARKFFPDNEVFVYLDFKKKTVFKNGIPTNTMFPDIQYLVDEFYNKIWNDNKLGVINDQTLATIIFDFIVNSGSAKKEIQKIVGVVQDGIFGPKTIEAINSKDPNTLARNILKRRKEKFELQVKNDATQATFFKGWMNRVNYFNRMISTTSSFSIVLLILVIILLTQL